MYLEHFGLKEPPFAITPDPRFVFLSERHRDALAHLLYGIGQGGSGGFVLLTGEVGTGKTTLSRLLLEQLPENTRVALVLNPRLTPTELLETICEELKLDIEGCRGSVKGLVDALNAYLLEAYAAGLRVVLIVDEAQNLSTDALEQIRLLTNLETHTQKLLQIILIGQPELRALIERPELRQLSQRITARYHLTPLDAAETEEYVRHRLAVAGCERALFSRLALRALYRHSGGIPRVINVIADRALLAAYARELDTVSESLVHAAAREALGLDRRKRRIATLTGLSAVLLLLLVGGLFWPSGGPSPPLGEVAADRPSAADFPVLGQGELIERLAKMDSADAFAAWRRLLARWQVQADEVRILDPARCPATLVSGLYCTRGVANIGRLRTLRRPVLLRLSGAEREGLALLLGIGRTRARLELSGESVEIALGELEALWRGEYFAIWRGPPFLPPNLRRGDHGPGVSWLLEVLEGIDGLRTDELIGPPFFDAALAERIRRFQLAQGLSADGIAGPETLLALTAAQRGGPRLARRVP
ncbi:MAG: general secretion pathway protein GspA [Lysobacterales bacterium]|jgi:general secretion pathway protein A|nr:MAG: general secretion pathway protein GspA [Xanthomonadales bacterium]